MSARFPRKGLILVLLVGFVVATIASALLPSFGLVLVARFVAGLPHGAYFGIASLVAASLMGPGKRARGVALVLSGLTIANVIGVPAITWLGQAAGWRIVSWEKGPDDDVDAVFSDGRNSVDLEVFCNRGRPTVAELERNTLGDD